MKIPARVVRPARRMNGAEREYGLILEARRRAGRAGHSGPAAGPVHDRAATGLAPHGPRGASAQSRAPAHLRPGGPAARAVPCVPPRWSSGTMLRSCGGINMGTSFNATYEAEP